MENYPIKEVASFDEFHQVVTGIDGQKSIFRGVQNAHDHLLIPSVGRRSLQRGKSGLPSYEQRVFGLFREMALPYLENVPQTDIEWLALAQHHGLPTRLLDWTYNPLVAAFFAVEKLHDTAGAVFVYRKIQTVTASDSIDPFSVKRVCKFRPPHFTERVRAQQSVFTLHPNPRVELQDSGRITKIIIPPAAAVDIRNVLNRYHIGRSSLFPGLDGVAREIADRHAIER